MYCSRRAHHRANNHRGVREGATPPHAAAALQRRRGRRLQVGLREGKMEEREVNLSRNILTPSFCELYYSNYNLCSMTCVYLHLKCKCPDLKMLISLPKVPVF